MQMHRVFDKSWLDMNGEAINVDQATPLAQRSECNLDTFSQLEKSGMNTLERQKTYGQCNSPKAHSDGHCM